MFAGSLSISTMAQIIETNFKALEISKTEWESFTKQQVEKDGILKCGISCAVNSDCNGIHFDDKTGTFNWKHLFIGIIQIRFNIYFQKYNLKMH